MRAAMSPSSSARSAPRWVLPITVATPRSPLTPTARDARTVRVGRLVVDTEVARVRADRGRTAGRIHRDQVRHRRCRSRVVTIDSLLDATSRHLWDAGPWWDLWHKIRDAGRDQRLIE
jgi:hypothetical protein